MNGPRHEPRTPVSSHTQPKGIGRLNAEFYVLLFCQHYYFGFTGGVSHFHPQMASSWRAAFRASTDGPFGTARLGMLPFVFPGLVMRYKHHLGRRWLVCFRFHCEPTSIPKIYQIRALRNRTQRTRMVFGDGRLKGHEQGLSNGPSPKTIQGR